MRTNGDLFCLRVACVITFLLFFLDFWAHNVFLFVFPNQIDANKHFLNLPLAFDTSSSYELAWQALHMAAAAACRGSTPTGRSGTHVNTVLARNPRADTCAQLCSESPDPMCDAEVSIRGGRHVGKATENGERVAKYHSYGC